MGQEFEADFTRQENRECRLRNEGLMGSEAVVFSERIRNHIAKGDGVAIEFYFEPKDPNPWGVQSIDGLGIRLQDSNYVIVQSILSGTEPSHDRTRDIQVIVGNSEEAKFFRVLDAVIEPSKLGKLMHRNKSELSVILTHLMFHVREDKVASTLMELTNAKEVLSGVLSKK